MQSEQQRRDWLASLDHNKWLAELKKDDLVVVSGQFGEYVRKVIRRTSTQIIVVKFNQPEEQYAERFNAKTGKRVGDTGYIVPRLTQCTHAKIQGIRRLSLIDKLGRIQWNKYDLPTIEAVFTVIFEADDRLKKEAHAKEIEKDQKPADS